MVLIMMNMMKAYNPAAFEPISRSYRLRPRLLKLNQWMAEYVDKDEESIDVLIIAGDTIKHLIAFSSESKR